MSEVLVDNIFKLLRKSTQSRAWMIVKKTHATFALHADDGSMKCESPLICLTRVAENFPLLQRLFSKIGDVVKRDNTGM